jgi:tetratricopeptide (TPR) repeat protein
MVIANGGKSNSEAVARAEAGMARIALVRNDVAAALAAVKEGLRLNNAGATVFDVRVGSELWCLYARALAHSGRYEEALVWARRAVDADSRYDAPISPALAEANQVLRDVEAGAKKVRRAGAAH